MKAILIILIILSLAVTSLFGITIINRNKDTDNKDEYSLETEEKSEDSITTSPDSQVGTVDDAQEISKIDMDNMEAGDEESVTAEEDLTDEIQDDETASDTLQDGEEEAAQTAQDETEEDDEEAEEIIEDNTIRVFLDGDMENGIYLGETICDLKSAEASGLYGEELENTGFKFTYKNSDISFLPGSTHYIYIYFYSTGSGWDYVREEINLPGEKAGERNIIISIDKPQEKAITESLELIEGWALDLRNDENPGIEKVEIYLNGPKDYGKSIGSVQILLIT